MGRALDLNSLNPKIFKKDGKTIPNKPPKNHVILKANFNFA